MDGIEGEKLEETVESLLNNNLYPSALHLAEKLFFHDPTEKTTLLLSKCYFQTRQFRRAIHLLTKRTNYAFCDSDYINEFCLIASNCAAECRSWQECIEISRKFRLENLQVSCGKSKIMASCLFVLRGKAYLALENHSQADACFLEALKWDPFCWEAFQLIVRQDHHKVSSLLHPFLREISDSNSTLFGQKPVSFQSYGKIPPSVLRRMAEELYHRHRLSQALELTSAGLREDPYDRGSGLALVHLAVLCSMKRSSDLFLIAHRLMANGDDGPAVEGIGHVDGISSENASCGGFFGGGVSIPVGGGSGGGLSPLAWYSVGCYYYSVLQFDFARRYFSKGAECASSLSTFSTTSPSLPSSEQGSPTATSPTSNSPSIPGTIDVPTPSPSLTIPPDSSSSISSTLSAYLCYPQSLGEIASACWFGYGHSYALLGEHDQAMAAYRSAALLLHNSNPGSPGKNHHVLLAIATEFTRVNNYHQAAQNASVALQLCPNDPLVYHESGVVAYKERNFSLAANYFQRALFLCRFTDIGICEDLPGDDYDFDSGEDDFPVDSHWEATVLNLAHCYRKLKRYDDAVRQYKRALSLRSDISSTYTALGFTFQLMGCYDRAIDQYHIALGLKSEDSFAAERLATCFELWACDNRNY